MGPIIYRGQRDTGTWWQSLKFDGLFKTMCHFKVKSQINMYKLKGECFTLNSQKKNALK